MMGYPEVAALVDSGELQLEYGEPKERGFRKKCKYCGMPFETDVRNRVYCNADCGVQANYEKRKAREALKKAVKKC